MNLRYCLTLIFCIAFIGMAYSQVDDNNIRQQVLQKRKIGKEYKFVNPKDSTLTFLKYLGQLTTKTGTRYNVLTSTWIFGLSHKANCRILVFDNNNKHLGTYFVSGIADLPDRIESNKLVFTNTTTDCDKKVASRISFSEGIPEKFFRECKNGSGDIYSFGKGE